MRPQSAMVEQFKLFSMAASAYVLDLYVFPPCWNLSTRVENEPSQIGPRKDWGAYLATWYDILLSAASEQGQAEQIIIDQILDLHGHLQGYV